jgi:tRNA(Ile)-lysidine synthase
MLNRVNAFVRRHGMPEPPANVLLLVSGGVDSMVLLHLLHQAGYAVKCLHLNYGLRGEASDLDQQLIEQVCQKLTLPLRVWRCGPDELKGNVQLKAREIRYRLAEQYVQEWDCEAIATAHHLDDSLETFWLNLVRGTGIEGVKGISPFSAGKIRPLLWATAQEIRAFAEAQGIPWREDESNAHDAYRRNGLRHHVLPVLKSWNPKWEEGFAQTLEKLQTTAELQRIYLNRLRQQLLHEDETTGERKISVLELAGSGINAITFGWLLAPYGFSESQGRQIFALPEGENGKRIVGAGHTAYLNMPFIFIREQEKLELPTWKCSVQQLCEGQCEWLRAVELEHGRLADDPLVCTVVVRNAKDIVAIRPWRPGDKISCGKGHKKVSDVLNEAGVSVLDKPNKYVVEVGGVVVWVLGLRKAPCPELNAGLYIELRWEGP